MHAQALDPAHPALPGAARAAARRWRRAAAGALLALLAAGATWPCRAQAVAVLIDGGGASRAYTSSSARPVETLDLLNAGTRLQVDAVAQIVVLYLASGVEFQFTGPGVVEVGGTQLIGLSGLAPVMRTPAAGKEIRLRTQRTAQGGVVLRSVAVEAAPAASPDSVDPQSRRPADDAPVASWVAYALWLEQIDAAAEARTVWRRVAAERPGDTALAQRAR
jgi:hypothetical protein